jgi:hypothetical protein
VLYSCGPATTPPVTALSALTAGADPRCLTGPGRRVGRQTGDAPRARAGRGRLDGHHGITADAAFALLQFHSQNRNVKIRAIAAQLTTLMCDQENTGVAYNDPAGQWRKRDRLAQNACWFGIGARELQSICANQRLTVCPPGDFCAGIFGSGRTVRWMQCSADAPSALALRQN